MRVDAPWTPEQVEALERWQATGWVNAFTCAHRTDPGHPFSYRLRPTPEGWICPGCGWTQEWAHDFMLDARRHPPEPFS